MFYGGNNVNREIAVLGSSYTCVERICVVVLRVMVLATKAQIIVYTILAKLKISPKVNKIIIVMVI